MSNLNALVDYVLHPYIPYFDKEHLIVGGVTGLVSIVLIQTDSLKSGATRPRERHLFCCNFGGAVWLPLAFCTTKIKEFIRRHII